MTLRQEYQTLLGELEKYNPDLLKKNRLLAISKSDMLDDELKQAIHDEIRDLNPLFFSSIAQMGIGGIEGCPVEVHGRGNSLVRMSDFLNILPEVQEALMSGQAVVALESTIVAHGMPYPQNLENGSAIGVNCARGRCCPCNGGGSQWKTASGMYD
jgi:hypothetical protein